MKLAVLAALVGLALAVPDASSRTVAPEVGLSVKYAPGDTFRVIARWGPSTNNLGPADQYEVLFTSTKGFRREKRVTGLSDTAMVPIPVPPDSVQVTVAVTAYRRNVASSTVSASKWFKRSDAPPPPPGPITIDTTLFAVQVDSVGVWLSRTSISAANDTTTGCALVHAGTRWYIATPSIQIKSTHTSLTTARLDAFAQASPGNCTYVYGPRGLLVDSLMPVVWTTDSVVVLGPGGPEFREIFGVRIKDRKALAPHARAH